MEEHRTSAEIWDAMDLKLAKVWMAVSQQALYRPRHLRPEDAIPGVGKRSADKSSENAHHFLAALATRALRRSAGRRFSSRPVSAQRVEIYPHEGTGHGHGYGPFARRQESSSYKRAGGVTKNGVPARNQLGDDVCDIGGAVLGI